MNSMTGFGKANFENDKYSLSITIKSVNHRFLDVSFKTTSLFDECETLLLKEIQRGVKRGHLEIMFTRKVKLNNKLSDKPTFELNHTYLKNYLDLSKQAIILARAKEEDVMPLILANLLNKKEILEGQVSENIIEESFTEEDKNIVLQTFSVALAELIQQRAVEGTNLKVVLKDYLEQFAQITAKIRDQANGLAQKLGEKLKSRLENFKLEIEPNRLAQEIAILADRIDISEELVRLDSHYKQFLDFLELQEAGKKMDFLIQEMGREINTLGSKAQNSEISSYVISAKAILEKLREQVQNIE
ncbi:MAG: YicC family protein [Deltaproteobacteria bacterium]|jgi:large subunit ribosomal protein L28|nr:YicC family protein [Deltaproteobacteria bacterium]